MKTKRIIGFLLVFALVTALLPMAVSAAPAAHTDHDSQDDGSGSLHDGWTAISTKDQLEVLAANGGSGFLTQDINLSDEIWFNSNAELCLNGYRIIQTKSDSTSCVLKVFAGKTLTVYDKTDDSGKITHGANSTGIGVNVEGSFIMEGGEISGNNDPDDYGGGVYIWGGSFSLSGGAIKDNTGHFGGGICSFNNGSFTMTGGEISGNTAESYGGGIFVQGGAFTMSGGEISGNTAGHSGGGLFINTNAAFYLSGGEITANTATIHGGGICMNGPIHMSGGKISGNTSEDGNGLYYGVSDSSSSTVTGGYLLNSVTTVGWALPTPFHSVTLNSNDGSEKSVTQYIPANTSMQLVPDPFTSGSGYTFEGWNTDPAGNGTPYSDGGTISINSDIALYAQWSTNSAAAPTITAQPDDAALTYGYTTGATLTVGATAADGHTVKYQWYSCDDASGANPKAVDGATNASYTVPAGLSVGSYHYCCYVTAERTDNSATETAASDAATVTVGKKALAVTAKDQEYVFNGSPQGEAGTAYEAPAEIAGKVSVEGLVNGDALTSVILNGQDTDVGVYPGQIEPTHAAVRTAAGKDATGNYDVTYTAGGLTILRAAPDCTAPDGLTAAYGQTLADVELPEGWVWDDPLSTSVGSAGDHPFSATFIPKDTENYSTVTVTLTISVTKAGVSSADLTEDEKPKALDNLIEDVFEQALVTAPEKLPEGYIGVEYSVDGENWTDQIPTAQKAGDCTVWVKYVGDADHEDFVGEPITVTVVKAVYAFTHGEGEILTYTTGSNKELTVTVGQAGAEDKSFEHFVGVYIGETMLQKDADYTVKKGSTIVTILPAALDKPGVGSHTLTIRFSNGEVSIPLTVLAANSVAPTSPPTGCSSPIALRIILMTVSACAAASLFLIGGRNRVSGK